MSYFAPYIDDTGLHIPTYQDILTKRIEDARTIFGSNIYLGNDSLEYQMISVESLAIYECMQAIQYAYNQSSPATAVGAGLSSLVQINGVTRRSASHSMCDVTLLGDTSALIVNGEVMDKSGYKWSLPSPITLQESPHGEYPYSLTVTATCKTIGAIPALAGDLDTISTPVAGWMAVFNEYPASQGLPVESDSELRERQALSVALPSQTILEGTIAALASLTGVTRLKVYENATSSTSAATPGVPFEGAPAHSITAVVEGGDNQRIAEVIYNNRGLGCYTNGEVSIDIAEPTYGTITPIRFSRPAYVPIFVEVTVKPLTGYTAETEEDIISAVAAYINSLGIGESLAISSIINAAVDVVPVKTRPSFSILDLKIGKASNTLDEVDIEAGYNEVMTSLTEDIEVIED